MAGDRFGHVDKVGFLRAASWLAPSPTFEPCVAFVLCYDPHIMSYLAALR